MLYGFFSKVYVLDLEFSLEYTIILKGIFKINLL